MTGTKKPRDEVTRAALAKYYALPGARWRDIAVEAHRQQEARTTALNNLLNEDSRPAYPPEEAGHTALPEGARWRDIAPLHTPHAEDTPSPERTEAAARAAWTKWWGHGEGWHRLGDAAQARWREIALAALTAKVDPL